MGAKHKQFDFQFWSDLCSTHTIKRRGGPKFEPFT